MSFFDKEDYTLDDILNLVENRAEESLHLEFKESRALGKDDKSKREITKDVSSFANSDGGIIVYGIQEKDHKASHFTFIDGTEFTKEWLELVINNGIFRKIPGLKIFPIRCDGILSKSIYLVKIPQSTDAPHMNKEQLYYKRYNFQSVKMEEYEVRQLYFRRNATKLSIEKALLSTSENNDSSEVVKFQLSVFLKNSGDVLERDYKVLVNIKNGSQYIVDINKISYIATFYSVEGETDLSISMDSSVFGTIFPTELQCCFSVYIFVDKRRREDFISSCELDITVFSTGGVIKKSVADLKSIVRH